MTVLVTGATGTTGSRVAHLLDRAGTDVRRAAPSSVPRFDWADPTTHDPVFDDVDRAYVIAPPHATEPADVVGPVLDRAVRRGLRRVVILSSFAIAPSSTGIGALHDLVLRAVPEPVVLRAAWFTQNFLGQHLTAHGLRSGELVNATGDGRVPFVDAADIAAVAATSLLADTPPATELIVTGPEAVSYAEVCRIYTEITGHPARHTSVSAEQYARRLVELGTPADFAGFLAGLDTAIASGALAGVSDTVESVTGRAPRSVRDTLTDALSAPVTA